MKAKQRKRSALKALRLTVVDDVPPAPPVPRAIAKHAPADAIVRMAATADRAIVLRRERDDQRLVLVDAGSAHVVPGNIDDACIRRDGAAAYAVAHWSLARYELHDGKRTRVVALTPQRGRVLAVVADRYVFVGGLDATFGYDLDEIDRGVRFKLASAIGFPDNRGMGTVLDGRVLWISTARDTLFATVVGGKLVRLPRAALPLAVEERDGVVFGRASDDRWFRIDGLAEMVEATAPAARRTPAMALVAIDTVPEYPVPPAAWKRRAKCDLAWYRWSPTREPVGYDGKRAELVWFDRAGKRRTFTPATMVRNFDRDADHRVAVATSTQLTLFDGNGKCTLDRALVKRPEELVGVAFVAGDLLAVLSTEAVRLVDHRGATKHRVALRHGRTVQSLLGRFVVVGGTATYAIEVFEIAGKRLVRRFRDKMQWQNMYAVGDRFFAQATTGAWFELTGDRLRA